MHVRQCIYSNLAASETAQKEVIHEMGSQRCNVAYIHEKENPSVQVGERLADEWGETIWSPLGEHKMEAHYNEDLK